MIKFSLACEKDHVFDAWFSSSEDFDAQKKRKLVECPFCGSTQVDKTLMAPSVSTARQQANALETMRNYVAGELKKVRDHVTENFEDVGERFPEEARKIHYGESEARGIYGAASKPEVESLIEEGVEIAPLPPAPEEAN
ncbi:MAG: DUF1178 family protein [Pseudomonadota bacterium]